jgi:hypothetical protein
MNLLSVSSDAKTVKGEKKGWLTGILYLAPADESGVINLCTSSSPGCRESCLYTAGRAALFPMINQSRIRKTKWYVDQPFQFREQLIKDIAALERKAKREGFRPCVRLNGTSDLPKLAHAIAPLFPKIQFYDYTKHPRPWERTLPNYHLTFSLSETNIKYALEALEHGVNVAVVFDTKKGQPMPKTWNGYKVYDGDQTDLRFKNGSAKFNNSSSHPSNAGLTKLTGIIIGLRAKGRAKKDCTGFVIRNYNPNLIQIARAA